MTETVVFISYRREESASEAGRLYDALCGAGYREDEVYMDTSSNQWGVSWPEEIQGALHSAKAIIALIGPDWLRANDEWGQRRIDQEADWVRRELEIALSSGKPVLPLLLDRAVMPPADKLPPTLAQLPTKHGLQIRRDYWRHDIQLLLKQLEAVANTSATMQDPVGPYPVPPPERPDPISEAMLQTALEGSLVHWKRVASPLPEDSSRTRDELFREYEFRSFIDAIDFMREVAPGCNIAIHHPRWENIFKTLRVYLTTWDIGHKISDRDIQLAKYFDKAYSEFNDDGR